MMVTVAKLKRPFRIRSLVPSPPHTENLPQCSAYTGDKSAWNHLSWRQRVERCMKKGSDPRLCTKGAGIEIDGKPYCRQHAGAIAIDILLGRK